MAEAPLTKRLASPKPLGQLLPRIKPHAWQLGGAMRCLFLVRLSPGFFTEQRTGELTSGLSADTAVIQTVISYNLSEFARQSLFLVGGVVLLTMTHPKLAATTLAVVPVVIGAAFVFGRMLRRASDRQGQAHRVGKS